MTLGPIDFVAIGFPGNKFSGKIIPALKDLVASGTIRILDIVFVKKDADGNIQAFEFSALGPEEAALFDHIEGEINNVISDTDIQAAAEALPNNSSAGLLLWENTWAERFKEAVIDADGHLLAYGRLSDEFVKTALADVPAKKP
jgi:uncharacterized membrane protein